MTIYTGNSGKKAEKKNAPQSEQQKNISSLVKNITSLLMSFFIYVAFVINAKSWYFIHFAYFVIAHCRTFVLPASRFLVCVHFRSSSQRVDFIDTLKESAEQIPYFFAYKLYTNLTSRRTKAVVLISEYVQLLTQLLSPSVRLFCIFFSIPICFYVKVGEMSAKNKLK